jgi:hypothetical protein
MKTFKTFLLLVAILAISNCTQVGELSEAEKLAISEEIQNRANGYSEALINKDLNWFQSFWSDEEDFVFAGDGLIQTEYDAVITQPLSDLFPNLDEVLHFEFTNGYVCVLGRNAASYATNFNWGMVMSSGDTLQSKGSWLYVFKRSNDEWRVVQSAGTHNYF